MRIHLADQHVQLRCAQFLLLRLDLIEQPPDILQHLIVRVPDLIQLCVRVQLYRPLEIRPVESGHCLPDRADRLCKSLREIDTDDKGGRGNEQINPRQHKKDGDDPLVQHPVRHKGCLLYTSRCV